MKGKRFLMVNVLVLVTMITVSPFLFGCAAEAPEAKTVRVGVNIWFGWPPGIDGLHAMEVMEEMVNQKGGINVGGDNYKLKLIIYDNNNNQATAQAATNRLIFEDKVKYILSDAIWGDSYNHITEENKIINIGCPHTTEILKPDKKYSFGGAYGNVKQPTVHGWFFQNNPDVKYMAHAAPDNVDGHGGVPNFEACYKASGVKCEWIFYPPDTPDMSAMAAKVMSLNPDCFCAMEGGPAAAALAFKAVWQAGYKGKLFYGGGAATQMLGIAPAEALEGVISSEWPTEFDPVKTEYAKEFKDAWIAKYGSWEGPEILFVSQLCCLMAGLEKAGSLDTDKVAEAIGSGLEFDSPCGASKMFSRPDLGNDRTVDSAVDVIVAKMAGGNIVEAGTVSVDGAISFCQQVYGK